MVRFIFLSALLSAISVVGLSAAEIGAQEFVPTTAQPLGWRGDGTDRWPGATPVTEWDEKTGKNIKWKAPLERFGHATPIVCGDKVFAMMEPDTLICLNRADGSERWRLNAFAQIYPQVPAAERQSVCDAMLTYMDSIYQYYFNGIGYHKRADLRGLNARMDAWLDKIGGPQHDNIVGISKRGETIPVGYPGAGKKAPRDGAFFFKTDPVLQKYKIDYVTTPHRIYPHWTTTTFQAPVTDGERVYALFNTDTIVCADMNGSLLWSRKLGRHNGLKQINPDPILLFDDRLVFTVCNRNKGTVYLMDAKSGKDVCKPLKVENAYLHYDRAQNITPLTVDGKKYALLHCGHLLDVATAKILGNVVDGQKFHGRFLTSYGSIQFDDHIYTAWGGYATKMPGVRAWRLTGTGADMRCEQAYQSFYKGIKANKKKGIKAISESAWFAQGFTPPKGWNGGLDWRGFVVTPKTTFMTGAGHRVIVADRATGKIIATPRISEVKCDNTPLPAYADGKVYITNWTGLTGVYDAATGKVLSINKTEPMHSMGMSFHGSELFVRSHFHVYCIGN